MGRRKKTTGDIAAAAARAAVKASQESGEGVELEFDDDAPRGEADALAALAQLGGDAEYRYVISCLSPLDKKGQIEELTREDITELPNYLRDKFGPGRYEVRTMGPDGYVKGGYLKITISSLALKRAPAESPAVAASAGGFNVQEWMAMQEKRDEARRLEAREDRKFMLGLLVPLLAPMLKPATLADQAAAMQALQGLNGGSGPEKAIEMLSKGLELGKELNAGGATDGWSVVRDILKDLAPAGNKLLDGIANRMPGQPARVPMLPPPNNPPATSPAPVVPVTPAPGAGAAGSAPGDPMLEQVKPLLHKLAAELAEFAENGASPELAAHAVVAKIPRMVRAFVKPEQLQAWLTHPDWWALASNFHPALKPHPGFCDDVRQTLLAILTEEAQAPAEDEGEESQP